MRLFASVSFLALAVFAHAAPSPDVESTPLSAKELAQGFREHVILARPHAARRARADADEAREGVRVREKFARFGDLRVIDLAQTDDLAATIARLRATGRYEFVEPDYVRHITAEPNDPLYLDGALWGLKNTGLSNGIPGTDIAAAEAWNIVHDAPSVIVAVVDTGVNLSHQDIVANLWTNPSPTFGDLHGARFINNGQSGNPTDDNGHGTHVAGTIGGVGNNGVGVSGIAWRVQIMAVKVFPSSGSGSVRDIAKGIDYAVAHGAHIINASYGESGSTGFSQTELAALTAARNAGVIVVTAAGNAAANMDVTRYYPASHALENIVTVGASTRRDELATFSNYGAPVDLFAPGSEILSLGYTSTTGTATMSGTSMAAPHVAGALALLKANFPNDTYRQLINRLLRGVSVGDRFVGKSQTGGRLNLRDALLASSNRPFNDEFARRPHLAGNNLAIRSSNTGATPDPGEPAHAGSPASASLWWEWTAPSSGTVTLDTTGSEYNTVLAVYTAPTPTPPLSPAGLTLVAANDDTQTSTTSLLSFSAQAGTTYFFAVDGKGGQTGLTLLNLGVSPANDTFASALALSGPSLHLTATNVNCTREPGEPHVLGWTGGTSLWYRWTAPRSGRFQFSAVSNDFDPTLGIFTGSGVASLHSEAESAGNANVGALCTLDAIAGTTYFIQVDAKTASTIGQFTLSVVDSLWQSSANDVVTSSAAAATDGTLYVGSSDNALYAFNPDGTQKWSYVTNGLIDTCSPAVASDGTVYISSNDGRLYALSPGGVLKWWHDFGSLAPVSNSPALAADGTIYVKVGDGYLYALNPADGATKWKFNVNAKVSYASPVVGADGTIYQGSEDKKLYAINPDGTAKWAQPFNAGDDIYTAPAIDGAGNLYFTVLNSGKLFSVSPAGTQRWVYTGGKLGSSSSPALSADGNTVYFGGYDAKLHAVNTANGSARWAFPLGDEVRASSPAVDATGVIYIGCYDFKLYAIYPDGTLKRTYDTGNWIRSSPLIYGNTLYVGSNDHKLYAFDIGAGPAPGPWSQYRQNVHRLGRGIVPPAIALQPVSQTVSVGGDLTLTATATGDTTSYQWQRNGAAIAGATTSAFTLPNFQPANTGLYTAVATNAAAAAPSVWAIVGLTSSSKALGTANEVGTDIVHPVTRYTYDQVLLQGPAATITADSGQIVRMSFIDLSNDIVQVEFSGAGALSLVLEGATGPAMPTYYNQPNVTYMKGHAGIVITGADETTNLSVFSVGRGNAVDQSLFRDTVTYDGVADIGFVAILSRNGKFGGLRTANATYFATTGLTGVYAPGVQFTGPVYVGDIDAVSGATPALVLGSGSDVQINGGNLLQTNGHSVLVSGIAQLRFVEGTTSHNKTLPAQTNKARLENNGADITAQIVIDPGP